MTLSVRFASFAVAVLAFLGMAASPALAAPTADELVNAFTTHTTRYLARTQDQIGNTSEATQNAIGRLDSEGASADAIVQAGERGKLRIERINTRSSGELQRRTRAALRTLERLEGTQAQIDAVNAAAKAARDGVAASAAAASSAIDAAVTAANSN